MPVNRNALIRIRTIDNCLQNRFRKWTLNDLIEACSDALYEYEGIDKGVSRRSIQGDIQLMRSNKLGYNAPIIVNDRKYYTYEDPDYSITNIPLTEQDLDKLNEVAAVLKQFSGFTYFRDILDMVSKLEDKIQTARDHKPSLIDFERNEHLKGLEFIELLYEFIQQKKCVGILYKSFKAKKGSLFHFSPYLLKEYRNRWFILGRNSGSKQNMILALDRIIDVLESSELYQATDTDMIEQYFTDVIGVTVVPGKAPEKVRLWIHKSHAPYILTKPIHHSQQFIEKSNGGTVIELNVQLNFELEREILGMGETVKVLEPPLLIRRIRRKIEGLNQHYS